MATLVIVGAQWGDEAKGKMVDVLADAADVVVRYSGGNNAGHTVITGGKTFKFQLLPAGILHPACTSVLGGGMAVCPKSLLDEIAETRRQQPDLGRLLVSASAHVVFPYHRLLDRLEEDARGDNKIGTTSRGIGPAYTDKVQRIGIRMGELVEPEVFRHRLAEVLGVKNKLLRMFGESPISLDDLYEEYAGYGRELKGLVRETDSVVQEAVYAGKNVMFEGAQGSFLDLDSGTYPYVTSSHPTAGGACIGTGIGPRSIDGVLGVCKAYTTRVGEGPFPTELTDGLGQQIRDQGNEYGTVTGRPRRCGWLDLVALRYSARLNSLSGLIVTRLDVLCGIGEVRVCTGYEVDGKPMGGLPTCVSEWQRVTPVYEILRGWDGDISCARHMDDLPPAVRDYLDFVEGFVDVPVAIVSVGPDREETVVARPQLVWGEGTRGH
jgi:adenylosuccinate synthase